jgi:hypothetical protein
MSVITGQRFLTLYSGALTLVFAVTVLGGFASGKKPDVVDELNVHRINVVEPDGTLRMVISDKALLPGVIVNGKEVEKVERPQAGVLFYNDEGSENGGLIFGGRKNEKGEVVDSGGSLSFDKYGANQIVQLAGVDDKTDKFAGLIVSDENRRVWVGRDDKGDASVSLMDAKGRKRLLLEVKADGTPTIAFLDENGKIVSRYPALSEQHD